MTSVSQVVSLSTIEALEALTNRLLANPVRDVTTKYFFARPTSSDGSVYPPGSDTNCPAVSSVQPLLS